MSFEGGLAVFILSRPILFTDAGQTVYTSRVLYASLDITAALQPGSNAIGARIGNYKWGYLDVWCPLREVGAHGCRAFKVSTLQAKGGGGWTERRGQRYMRNSEITTWHI